MNSFFLKVFLLTGLFCQGQIDSMTVETAFGKAQSFHYTQKDSAYHYYEKTMALADNNDDIGYVFAAMGYLINTNGYFYDLGNYRTNIIRMDSLLVHDARAKDFPYRKYYENLALFEEGNYNYKVKNYRASKVHFEQLRENLSQSPEDSLSVADLEMLSSMYSYLGLIGQHTSKLEQAEATYRKNMDLLLNNKAVLPSWESDYFNLKKLLSQVYEEQGKLVQANDLLNESLEFYAEKSSDPRYRNNILSTFMLYAKNFIAQKDFQGGIKALDRYAFLDVKENPFAKEIDLVYGDAYKGLAAYKKAEEKYHNALAKATDFRQNNPHQDLAEIHGKIAELYLEQYDYEEGLKSVEKAFNQAGSNIEITDQSENPDPEEVFSKTQLLRLLDIKLQLQQGGLDENAASVTQESALETSRAILNTFDRLKSEFDSKLDKQFLAERAYPIFHRMMKTAFSAYTNNSSRKTLQLALEIAEKNKDFILLEALRSAQANEYGGIPQKVLDREAQLRAEITYLEKEVFDARKSDSGFSEELFKLKQDYYGFLDTVKSKYPKYHNLKYSSAALDLAAIRENLLDDQGTLISYTLTDEYLYAIVVDGSKERFVKMPFASSDRETLREFYKKLAAPSLNGVEEITALGESLYEKILKKPLEGFDSENLTIIPDGELHYLPFDLLRHNGNYLLETKRIGYGNSVASLLELEQKKSATTNKVLAFAPSFADAVAANSDRQFGRLLYNGDEVDKIGAFFDTEMALGKKATLADFEAKTSGFNLFHFATHASANDEYPDYSYLAFTDSKDSTESNILYIKDLYNTALNADMVTLSACQTGIGKLQKGQGMLSLSKGFYYAGAKSLVNTLWKINDKSTVPLMEHFYRGLSEGKSKTEALRDAKLNYLATVDDELLKHPYYWAAFVVSGDVSPISQANSWAYWMAGLLVVGLLVVILMNRKTFFRRDKKGYRVSIIGKR